MCYSRSNSMTGLTQKGTKVGVIHELPLRKNKVFSHILRKSYMILNKFLVLTVEKFTVTMSARYLDLDNLQVFRLCLFK
jgi:hypothetical protein